MASLESRLGRLERQLGPDCPGPVITFSFGTRAGVDAPEPSAYCPRCGRPLAEHEGPFGVVFVDVPADAYEGQP
jgi:hypothetical protein